MSHFHPMQVLLGALSVALCVLGFAFMRAGIHDGLVRSRLSIPPWQKRGSFFMARGGAAHVAGILFGIVGAAMVLGGGLSLLAMLHLSLGALRH